MAVVPPARTSATGTVAALKSFAGGAFTVSFVALLVDGVTVVVPKRTFCTVARPVPEMVTVVRPATPPVRGAAVSGAPDDACTGALAEPLVAVAAADVLVALPGAAAPGDCSGPAHPVSTARPSAAAVATYARLSIRRGGGCGTAAV